MLGTGAAPELALALLLLLLLLPLRVTLPPLRPPRPAPLVLGMARKRSVRAVSAEGGPLSAVGAKASLMTLPRAALPGAAGAASSR
mmetsp:Transcript_116418/g.323574  ORF Transcript_116418/g.323574 Transcript_116418/m.323574 type:complete len:86 (+) Transcript_116418:218-475(+)